MTQHPIPLKCSCGEVEGKILISSTLEGNNITCMCDDCQSFAYYLHREHDILNENKGTPIFQITPNKISIHKGKNNLACLQLKSKGLKRWYTNCCKTPVANTISSKIAFNGIFHQFIDFQSMDPQHVKEFQSFKNHCMGKFGKGPFPVNTSAGFPLSLTLNIAKTILWGFFKKTYKPNTFFDLDSGNPISKPRILAEEVH
ncbi:MAG: DUF6151 family protein [Oligoflexales bacterium]